MIKVNGIEIKSFVFPGGECQVSIDHISIKNNVSIKAKLFSSDAVMKLLLTVDAIRTANPEVGIVLEIPYFPYGRQDRICNKGESFSLKVMAGLINDLECQKVTILDPHSIATPYCLSNVEIIDQWDLIKNTPLIPFINLNKLAIVSPDEGAHSKTAKVASMISGKGPIEFMECKKIRNSFTGEILGVQTPKVLLSENMIILDDICDGGRTFIELSKSLKSSGAKNIYLYVTHGIFSKGLSALRGYFDHVFCYHTFLQNSSIDRKFLTILGE